MRFDILTLFPQLCDTIAGESIIGRGIKNGYLQVCCHNIRNYTLSKQARVDDAPYGGGRGMVLQCQPIDDCFAAVVRETGSRPHFIYMSPKGKTLTQQRVRELSRMEHIAILCGHYEGVDQRVLDKLVDEEISVGDYVLTGGELPAMTLVDAVGRLIPGVLSEDACFEEESHFKGMLEYPQYTRPAAWQGREVPEVLLTGHHDNIARWRLQEALKITLERRPDMLDALLLRDEEREILEGLKETK